jgi:predicted O-methyltransferase YrrM
VRTTPWLTEYSIEYIMNFIKNQKKRINILEFGCGGSTIFFSNIDTNLISIEHDEEWFTEINKHVNKDNCLIILKKSKVIEGTDYLENSYFNVVNELEIKSFDFILIDGRDRVECFKKSEPLLVDGGIIVLDNSERDEYKEIFELYKNKEQYSFVQKLPDKYGFIYENWTTTIFLK